MSWKTIQIHEKMHIKTAVLFCWSRKHTFLFFPTERSQLAFANVSRGLLSDLVTCWHAGAEPHDQICTFRQNNYSRKFVLAFNCSTQKANNCQEFKASTGYRDPVSTTKSTLECSHLVLCNWIEYGQLIFYLTYISDKLQKNHWVFVMYAHNHTIDI